MQPGERASPRNTLSRGDGVCETGLASFTALRNDAPSATSIDTAMATIEEEEVEQRRAWRREQNLQMKIDSRLGLPYLFRLLSATSISFVSGMALGISHGSQTTGFRFRAENAHRLPTTPTGWYLYHKSKNYNMALGGVKEGLKMGAKVSVWTAGFFAIEEMFDRYRGTKDFINTVIASLSVAGGFSLWSTPFLLDRSTPTNFNRQIPHHDRSTNGKEWISYRLSIWACTRCSRICEREETPLCGLHTSRRKTKSQHREQNGMTKPSCAISHTEPR